MSIGTASLAQVHKAVLNDGTTVAVKVQHKDIQDYSSSDVRTMEVNMLYACTQKYHGGECQDC